MHKVEMAIKASSFQSLVTIPMVVSETVNNINNNKYLIVTAY